MITTNQINHLKDYKILYKSCCKYLLQSPEKVLTKKEWLQKASELVELLLKKKKPLLIYGAGIFSRILAEKYREKIFGYIESPYDKENNLNDLLPKNDNYSSDYNIIICANAEEVINDRIITQNNNLNVYSPRAYFSDKKIFEDARELFNGGGRKWYVFFSDRVCVTALRLIMQLKKENESYKFASIILDKNHKAKKDLNELFDIQIFPDTYNQFMRILKKINSRHFIWYAGINALLAAMIRSFNKKAPLELYDVATIYEGEFPDSFIEAENYLINEKGPLLHRWYPEGIIKKFVDKFTTVNAQIVPMQEWVITEKSMPVKTNNQNNKLVYAGYLASINDKRDISYYFHNIFEQLLKQDFEVNVYPDWIYNSRSAYPGYLKLENKYNNFKVHKSVAFTDINNVVKNYDYFLILQNKTELANVNEIFKLGIPMKMFTAIEAGIPLIVSKEWVYLSQIVEENKIGITVSNEEIKNLKVILNNSDKKIFAEGIKNFRKKFNIKKSIKKFKELE